MKILSLITLVIILASQVNADCSANDDFEPGSSSTITITTASSGDRTCKVVIPERYNGTHPRPLFLVIHPLNTNNVYMELLSDFDDIADSENVVVAYPQGISNSWNAGGCCPSSWYFDEDVDDVAFLIQLLDYLDSILCLDMDKVFLSGMSNGAFMTFRLMCEYPDRFRAAGTVAAVLAQNDIPSGKIFECPNSINIPLFHIHGTDDPAVPYEGDPAARWPSVPDSMRSFADRNGCDSKKNSTTFVNGTYTCVQYDCPEHTNVTLCTGEGQGHIWPGSDGGSVQDIQATEEITKFFKKYFDSEYNSASGVTPLIALSALISLFLLSNQ